MNIQTGYNETDTASWSAFVAKHPHGSVFQTPEMVRVYERSSKDIPVVVALSDAQGIAALLVAVIRREHGGSMGRFSARSVIMGAPLLRSEDPALLNELLQAYHRALGKKAVFSQFRNHWTWNPELREVFSSHGYAYEDHLDILHDLTLPAEAQLAKMHAGRRKNIRRAEKMLTVDLVESDADFHAALALVKSTYKRIGLPLAEEAFFHEVRKEQGERLKVFAARHEGEMIGSRMVFCFNGMIYDWYAGSAEQKHDKYPNDYLPWAVMQWGSRNGYKTFDFGGAGNAGQAYGVRDYKLKFGGELKTFGRFQKIHKPVLMQLGKWALALYKKLKKTL